MLQGTQVCDGRLATRSCSGEFSSVFRLHSWHYATGLVYPIVYFVFLFSRSVFWGKYLYPVWFPIYRPSQKTTAPQLMQLQAWSSLVGAPKLWVWKAVLRDESGSGLIPVFRIYFYKNWEKCTIFFFFFFLSVTLSQWSIQDNNSPLPSPVQVMI